MFRILINNQHLRRYSSRIRYNIFFSISNCFIKDIKFDDYFFNFSSLIDIQPEISKALRSNGPVVALESTIITHGMPYPQNLETALAVEAVVRKEVCI